MIIKISRMTTDQHYPMKDIAKRLTAASIKISLLAFFNFLYFLIISRNISYIYGVYEVPTWPDMLQNPFVAIIILLKLCFAGFFIGQLAYPFVRKKHPKFFVSSIHTLCVITLAGSVMNYIKIPNVWLVTILILTVTLVPACIYGLLFGSMIRGIRYTYNKVLFYMLIGSSVAVFVYTYIFSYIPFISSLVIFTVVLRLWFIDKSLKRKLGVVLCGALLILGSAKLHEIYTYPGFVDESYIPLRTIFTPYGITDILYNSSTDRYQLLSDKDSITTISRKGSIQDVQHHAVIPYILKSYNNSLLIGIGGGQDAVAGLYYGTKHITVVDINETRIKLMKTYFNEYSHKLFDDKKITTVIDSARSFLRKTTDRFDLITIQRPWTTKIMNGFLYDTSSELFTEEALKSYLDHLTDDGIVYWALPYLPSLEEEKILLPIKNSLKLINNNLLIFSPYPGNKLFLTIFISKRYDLREFYQKYKDTYQFYYYPGMQVHQGDNEVVDYLFFNSGITAKATDKQIYGPLKKDEFSNTFYSMIIVFIALSALSVLLAVRNKSVVPINYLSYFYLGLGYEIVLLVMIISASLFISNLYRLLPIAYITAYGLGSIGYLHSERLKGHAAAIVCFILSGLFLITVYAGMLVPGVHFAAANAVQIILLFLTISYFLTFPFGYLLSKEHAIHVPLSIDYAGSFFYLPILFLLPNMDYLFVLAAVVYILLGLLLIVRSKISSR